MVSDGLLNANDPLLVVYPVLFRVREVLGVESVISITQSKEPLPV